jgi:hypothetical protein
MSVNWAEVIIIVGLGGVLSGFQTLYLTKKIERRNGK